MKKRVFAALGIGLLLSCLLAGCNSADTPKDTPAEEPTDGSADEPNGEPVEAARLHVRLLYGSNPVESVAIRAGEDPSEQYAARELQKYLKK